MTHVYRAPMRSRDDDVPEGIAVERALELDLCGMGGRLDPPPSTLDEARTLAARQHDDRLARRIGRFAEAPDGALVWTRDIDDALWLGTLDGPWRYDASTEATAADIVHVRTCRWLKAPVPTAQVPAEVHAAFARGGRNFQGIGSRAAAAASLRIAHHRGRSYGTV